MDSTKLIEAVTSVTKAWAKQRKKEERDANAHFNRSRGTGKRVIGADVLERHLPDAYMHVSGGGRLPASKRQIYYSIRDVFQEMTGQELDSQYFSQTLLPQYLNRHDVDWLVTADPRGTLAIPNASHAVRIPVGTLAIDRHLQAAANVDSLNIGHIPKQWPSLAHSQRYAAVLYIEKEGFEPIIQAARIAERFDLAILSCKGQSVVAARKFIDTVCGIGSGVPLFVVHDFDKAGFEIAKCLTTVSDAAVESGRVQYHFVNKINVTDFGLRLEDVEQYDLPAEKCSIRVSKPVEGMTDDEFAFLRQRQRVELNAFTSPQFVEWLEDKLKQHLPERLVPTNEIISVAYQRSLVVNRINLAIDSITASARQEGPQGAPDNLRQAVQDAMKSCGVSWDVALHDIVAKG